MTSSAFYLSSAKAILVKAATSDADALAKGNGLGESANAIQHAYVSASLTYDTNAATAEILGNLKEIHVTPEEAKDSYKVQWNNAIGRQIGQYVKDNNLPRSAIDDLLIDAQDRGQLIEKELTDPRVPGNPDHTPSSPFWSPLPGGKVSAGRDYSGSPFPLGASDFFFHALADLGGLLAGQLLFAPLWPLIGGPLGATLAGQLLKFAGVLLDPLIIDLDGDGLQLVGNVESGVLFDIDNDAFAENVGWFDADDGLLFTDDNSNGVVDNISELFGSATADAFADLAGHDGNQDGVINAQDAIFGDLLIWRDADSDGATDAGETLTLAELGIVEFSLAAAAVGGPVRQHHSAVIESIAA